MNITSVSDKSKVLIDSDGLIASYFVGDANHEVGSKIFKKLIESNAPLFVVNLVILEVATVLSHKVNQATAMDFVSRFHKLPITQITVDRKLEAMAWKLFHKQTKKGISFVDCANLVCIEQKGLDGIFSFDKFYSRELRVVGRI